jgi:hypothetical protein
VAAQIATIAGVPIAVIGIVLAAMALESKDNASGSNGGRPSEAGSLTAKPSPNPKPSPAPSELESAWERDQGRLCQEMNRQAAANPSAPSAVLSEQLPTLRAASAIIGEFVAESADLEAPESHRGQVQIMLGHWSEAEVFMTGMIRSAEQGDVSSFNQRFDEFNESMETGMQVARDLGALQCT